MTQKIHLCVHIWHIAISIFSLSTYSGTLYRCCMLHSCVFLLFFPGFCCFQVTKIAPTTGPVHPLIDQYFVVLWFLLSSTVFFHEVKLFSFYPMCCIYYMCSLLVHTKCGKSAFAGSNHNEHEFCTTYLAILLQTLEANNVSRVGIPKMTAFGWRLIGIKIIGYTIICYIFCSLLLSLM